MKNQNQSGMGKKIAQKQKSSEKAEHENETQRTQVKERNVKNPK